jgi:hypothetical protein
MFVDKENGKENNTMNRTVTLLIIFIALELVITEAAESSA